MTLVDPIAAPDGPSIPWIKKFIGAAGIVVLLGVVPMLIVARFSGPVAAAAFPLGFLGAILAAKGGSRQVALALAPVLIVGGTLSAFTGGSWWWVVLLGALGVLIGLLATAGRLAEIMKVSLVVVAAGVHRDVSDLPMFAGFLAIGYLLGLALMRLTSSKADDERPSLAHIDARRAAVLAGFSLALSGAIAVWLTQSFGWSKALWIPVLFLVFLEFYITDSSTSTFIIASRAVGTAIGIAILFPLLSLVPITGILVVLLVAAGLAFSDSAVWLSTSLITAGVVLASSGNAEPGVIEGQRLWATILAMLLIGFTAWATRWIRIGEKPTAP